MPWLALGTREVLLPTGNRDLFFHISDRLFTFNPPLSSPGSDSLVYICTPNSGNAAAKYDLANELAANADAAYNGYYSPASDQDNDSLWTLGPMSAHLRIQQEM